MDLLQRTGPHAPASTWRPGVYLPEQLMTDKHIGERRSLLQRLAKVPGTFTCRFSLPAPEEQAETTG